MEANLALTTQEISKLRRIITLAEKLIEKGGGRANGARNGKQLKAGKRIRRTGQGLMEFRKMLKAERKNGIPVAEMARLTFICFRRWHARRLFQ